MNISSYSDEQLLNLVNNSILKNTEFKIEEFSGGSISVTSVHKNTRQNYKVNLYFGYKGKNPINRSFDIKQDFYYIWCKAIHLKVIAIASDCLGADFNELNELMKNSNEVVSSKVDSKIVVSISTVPKDTLKGSIEGKLKEYSNINPKAFNEWVKHKKYKSISPITKLLNMFSKYSLQEQQDMVDKSIMNGWKGLVEPKQQSNIKSFQQQDEEATRNKVSTYLNSGYSLRDNAEPLEVEAITNEH